MNQYSGPSFGSDARTISIPDDIDVADSESVNAAFRSLKDSIRLGLATAAGEPIHHRVRLSSTNTSTIVSQPVSGYMQQVQSFVPYSYLAGFRAADVFSVLDLDIPHPTAFEPMTTYYCYNVWDPSTSTFTRRVSKGIPDESICFQKTDGLARYLGSFLTNSGQRPIQFSKSEAFYTFEDRPLLLQPVDNTPITFNLAPIVPFYCSRVRLRLELYNLTSSIDFCRVSAGGPEQSISMAKDSQSTAFIDLILRTKVLSVRLFLGSGLAPLNNVLVNLDGMWES